SAMRLAHGPVEGVWGNREVPPADLQRPSYDPAVPNPEELESAFCWEREDEVPRRPEMTEFRRRSRLQQARWRERHGHPIGSQPIAPKGKPSRPVGSRLPLDYARETGANFLTAQALAAGKGRTAPVQTHHRPH